MNDWHVKPLPECQLQVKVKWSLIGIPKKQNTPGGDRWEGVPIPNGIDNTVNKHDHHKASPKKNCFDT